VAENLNLVEAEINSLKAKSKALVDTGILSEAQVRLFLCASQKETHHLSSLTKKVYRLWKSEKNGPKKGKWYRRLRPRRRRKRRRAHCHLLFNARVT
jgi:hypothetical protein